MEPLEEILETIDVEHVPEGNPLKGRFLIFRKWAPPGNKEYIHYYAASPGEAWGITVRINYGNTDPNKMQVPYEICRVTMDSVLGADNVVATEEEFYDYYTTAMAEINAYMNYSMRPVD